VPIARYVLLEAVSCRNVPARIVAWIEVFEAQRSNGRYLSDVFTGLCPVEVERIAGQNDDAMQRQMLPDIASSISESVGCVLLASSAGADMI
jgi:hypothetical protein